MEKRKIKDLIIKIVLIAIIVLLLINNHKLITSLKKEPTKSPTGNVDIFEICCDKDNCNKDNTKKEKTNSSDTKITVKKNNKINNNDKQEVIDTDNEITDINNEIIDNTEENVVTAGENVIAAGENVITEENTDFTVSSNSIIWNSTNELRIFSNPVYNMDPKIAPGTTNVYQFVVKNNTSYNVKYSINFIEENNNNLNMRYRLKKGNLYVAGNNGYVTYEELNQIDININSGESNTYYLEWKWIGTENDNHLSGIQGAYSLSIEIEAESTNE